MKNCLVTGGAGFIGSHLVKRLLEDGAKVTVVDDLSEGKWSNLPVHPNLTKRKVSILENMSPFVAGKDIIFHLAAIPRLQRSIVEPWQTHRVNVDGTLNLLLEAKKHKVKKFIFFFKFVGLRKQKQNSFLRRHRTRSFSPLLPAKSDGRRILSNVLATLGSGNYQLAPL